MLILNVSYNRIKKLFLYTFILAQFHTQARACAHTHRGSTFIISPLTFLSAPLPLPTNPFFMFMSFYGVVFNEVSLHEHGGNWAEMAYQWLTIEEYDSPDSSSNH